MSSGAPRVWAEKAPLSNITDCPIAKHLSASRPSENGTQKCFPASFINSLDGDSGVPW